MMGPGLRKQRKALNRGQRKMCLQLGPGSPRPPGGARPLTAGSHRSDRSRWLGGSEARREACWLLARRCLGDLVRSRRKARESGGFSVYSLSRPQRSGSRRSFREDWQNRDCRVPPFVLRDCCLCGENGSSAGVGAVGRPDGHPGPRATPAPWGLRGDRRPRLLGRVSCADLGLALRGRLLPGRRGGDSTPRALGTASASGSARFLGSSSG